MPTARSMPRAAAFSRPSVTSRERGLMSIRPSWVRSSVMSRSLIACGRASGLDRLDHREGLDHREATVGPPRLPSCWNRARGTGRGGVRPRAGAELVGPVATGRLGRHLAADDHAGTLRGQGLPPPGRARRRSSATRPTRTPSARPASRCPRWSGRPAAAPWPTSTGRSAPTRGSTCCGPTRSLDPARRRPAARRDPCRRGPHDGAGRRVVRRADRRRGVARTSSPALEARGAPFAAPARRARPRHARRRATAHPARRRAGVPPRPVGRQPAPHDRRRAGRPGLGELRSREPRPGARRGDVRVRVRRPGAGPGAAHGVRRRRRARARDAGRATSPCSSPRRRTSPGWAANGGWPRTPTRPGRTTPTGWREHLDDPITTEVVDALLRAVDR